MTPESILKYRAKTLCENERRKFFDQGFLKLDGYIKGAELSKVQHAWKALVARSGVFRTSNRYYELSEIHCEQRPHPVVIKMVADLSPAIWDYVSGASLTGLAVDLLGPDVKFRESYINYKQAGVGRSVSWHQDFPFFPTTNRAMITVLTYFEDVTDDMGPIELLLGSHRGPIFDHYDETGWIGRLPDAVLSTLSMDETVSLPGPAGTVVVFDNFMVHGSKANRTPHPRPVMVTGYAAADAMPYTATPPSMQSPKTWQLLRGKAAEFAHHEPIKVRVPPDWDHQHYVPPDWPERDLISSS